MRPAAADARAAPGGGRVRRLQPRPGGSIKAAILYYTRMQASADTGRHPAVSARAAPPGFSIIMRPHSVSLPWRGEFSAEFSALDMVPRSPKLQSLPFEHPLDADAACLLVT